MKDDSRASPSSPHTSPNAADKKASSSNGSPIAAQRVPTIGRISRLAHSRERLDEAYSTTPHAQFEETKCGKHKVTIDYSPLKLSSFRVFSAIGGTILQDPILWIEQLIITGIFILAAIPPYVLFNRKLAEDRHGEVSIRRWLDEQEEKMRAFAMIMTTLAAFLLSFYTSMAVGRWWSIRTAGVGGMKAAAVELELYIYQLVTQEERVLTAIRRYARASLTLVFLWRRGQMPKMGIKLQDDPEEMAKYRLVSEDLIQRNLLTLEECENLMKWNHNLHESIWAWQAGIVTMLYKEGKIKSDQLLSLLLDRCSDGRQAVQLIHTYLAVKIPMQYVHLLGLLVKLHNTVLATIMGILFGAAVRNSQIIICCQLFGRTCLLPFLFNAILLINAELSDPFDGGMSDFPGSRYERALEEDIIAFLNATKYAPDWLARRMKADVKADVSTEV